MTEKKLQTSYDSIAQAAVALECSVVDLRALKKEGAPGFRGSRVYPAELVPYMKAKAEMAGAIAGAEKRMGKEALECRRLLRQCERLEVALAKEVGRSWDADQVKASWLMHILAARQTWLTLAAGLSPQLAGQTIPEIERRLVAGIDAGLEKLRTNPYGAGVFKCPHCQAAVSREDFEKGKEDESHTNQHQRPGNKSAGRANPERPPRAPKVIRFPKKAS